MSGFVERLRKHEEDRGMMANLRCILVDNKKHRAWPALSRLGVRIDDDVFAFVAGLFATHPAATESGNFGTTCKEIESQRDARSEDSKLTPTERRFQHLLSAETDEELFGRVLRLVRMAKAQAVPINYQQLLQDLRQWKWNQRVKTKWATAYWNDPASTDGEEGA